MRLNSKQSHRTAKPSSGALSVLLLVLFAHAFLVGATHLHRAASVGVLTAPQVGSIGGPEAADLTNEAGSDSQCLLCRLQRNFISDLPGSVAQLIVPPLVDCPGETFRVLSTPAPHFLVPSGRAPPFA